MLRRMVEVSATSEDLGCAFAAADSTQQSRFLVAMADYTDDWEPGDWSKQCDWIAKDLIATNGHTKVEALLSQLLHKLQVAAPTTP